jgi:hypothetical protein
MIMVAKRVIIHHSYAYNVYNNIWLNFVQQLRPCNIKQGEKIVERGL